MKNHFTWILPALAGAFLIEVWYAVIIFGQQPAVILPAPHRILMAMFEERDLLFPAACRTGLSAVVGFIAAVGGGVLLAVILASSRVLKRSIYPWILVMQMIPVIVLIPVFVIWFGEGMPSITAITFMISFFPVTANTKLGLVSTDKELLELFRMWNATRMQEILHLRIPYALPQCLTGMKIAGTLAPIGAITGDALAGAVSTYPGLGFLVQTYRAQLYTEAIFAVALVGCILGFMFVGAVNLLSWYLLRYWHESYLPEQHQIPARRP